MSDVLAEICAKKREAVAARKRKVTESALVRKIRAADPPRGFAKALERAAAAAGYGLICEIKKASPSQGLIREDFDPAALARAYADGGASCLSVLTEEAYFQGTDDDLIAARAAVDLPILRKDFTLDSYQVLEARALGADCILLILADLSNTEAQAIDLTAKELGLDVLVEVHDQAELERAIALDCQLIGINNRNLKTLEVDPRTTMSLAPRVPKDRLVVAESGLKTRADLESLRAAGARAFLIGESLMRRADVAAATAALAARAPAEPSARARA
ncbi:MAG TPA: indole-3-glycerol phosphate synthase TrpC [Kiloniellales bacterium]|nr:indole-3-glycerol phosphate synthase TrpC [Kiloniellales bacterium]